MNKTVVDSITDMFVNRQVIEQNDVNIYRYGVEVLVLSLFEVTSLLAVAFFVGNFFETVVFFLAFIPLRLFAGGYHAATKLNCYLISLSVYGMFCFFLRVIPLVFQAYFSIVIMIASVFIIYAWAPAIHNNHYIDKPDLIYYGKLSRIIIMLETFVVAIGYIAGLSQFSFAFSLGILAETFSIIATKIKRMKRKERK